MSEAIPDDVLKQWAKDCQCCPICWMTPCEACSAGGVCDAMPCRCDDPDDDLYEDDWPP